MKGDAQLEWFCYLQREPIYDGGIAITATPFHDQDMSAYDNRLHYYDVQMIPYHYDMEIWIWRYGQLSIYWQPEVQLILCPYIFLRYGCY